MFKQLGKLKNINGSILRPENTGLALILSTANLEGKVESPMIKLFDKRWFKVREDIKGWWATRTGEYKYGAIKNLAVQSDIWIVHMLFQSVTDNNVSSNLEALEECLKKVYAMAKYESATVHISSLLIDVVPELKDLATKYLINNGISTYFYSES